MSQRQLFTASCLFACNLPPHPHFTPPSQHKISSCLCGKKVTLGIAEVASLTFALSPGTLSNGVNTPMIEKWKKMVIEGSVRAVIERATGWVRQSFCHYSIHTTQVHKRASQTVNKVLLTWPKSCETSERGVICARWTKENDDKILMHALSIQWDGKDYDLVEAFLSDLIISIMFNFLHVLWRLSRSDLIERRLKDKFF